jgi:hypothetical protein
MDAISSSALCRRGKAAVFRATMLFACCWPGVCAGIQPDGPPIRLPVLDGTDRRVTHLSFGDGPSHRRVGPMIQDDLGFLWFGTDDGLKRYDGYRFPRLHCLRDISCSAPFPVVCEKHGDEPMSADLLDYGMSPVEAMKAATSTAGRVLHIEIGMVRWRSNRGHFCPTVCQVLMKDGTIVKQ